MLEDVEMAMSPFALSILGMEPVRRQQGGRDAMYMSFPEMRAHRSSPKRALSNYNTFQTICSPSHDSPPAYAVATRHKYPAQQLPREEVLPGYSCSVEAEARLLLQLESINPLHGISESEWREVYVTLRGTLLNIHRVKDGGAGKLLRSYTLQHAEVGLAPEVLHTVLVPQTRLARLIPMAARSRAWQKDPDLFRAERQTILRIRVETDQIILADSSEDRIHELIYAISAGIDISYDLDERTVPRQCTVPRRRRRVRGLVGGDLNDPSLLAEQERILRDMYPAFAERSRTNWTGPRPELQRTRTEDASNEPATTAAREDDELDLAVMREDFANPNAPAPTQTGESPLRPAMSRQTTASSVTSTLSTDMIYATSPLNFTASGKWQPPHPRTAAQIQRYARRCMPLLHAECHRASDILICHGKRVKINWRMELLEEWSLSPPSYKSHAFVTPEPAEDEMTELQRTRSQTSQSPSATNSSDSPRSTRGSVVNDSDRADQIEPIDTGLANLDLAKVQTLGMEKSSSPTRTSTQIARTPAEEKPQEAMQQPGDLVHGVVFCF